MLLMESEVKFNSGELRENGLRIPIIGISKDLLRRDSLRPGVR